MVSNTSSFGLALQVFDQLFERAFETSATVVFSVSDVSALPTFVP
jgi:hypothetical protein